MFKKFLSWSHTPLLLILTMLTVSSFWQQIINNFT